MLKKRDINKNYCLNFIKGCACFGVLYMHTSYDFIVSSIIACISRFAVLVFFMISGYYCFSNNRQVVNIGMRRKVKHISKLCIFSSIIYFIWDGLLSKLLLGIRIDYGSFFTECFKIKSIFSFILFNQLPFGGILWFLFALLYCYFIFWAVNQLNLYRVAYMAIPALIVIHVLSRGYIQYNGLIDETINVVYYRNFLFMGFPFFMLGNFIHRYEQRIIDKFSDNTLILLIGFGLTLSCAERLIVTLELYCGTIIATFCIFVFAVKNPQKKVIPIIATIGEKYSMQIYILHPIVSTVLYCIKRAMGIENNIVLLILNPLIIYGLITVMVSVCQETWNIMLLIKNRNNT